MARKQDPLTVEYLLLGLIQQHPIHAYDLDKLLNSKEELNIVWRFNQSQLYAVLDKLERNGLIQSKISTGSAFPFRKVYSLTDLGTTSFQKWKTEPVTQPNAMRSDFLAKLYFLQNEPLETFEAILNDQIKATGQWLGNMQQREEDQPEESTYQKMVLQFRIQNLEFILHWLNDCLEIKRKQSVN